MRVILCDVSCEWDAILNIDSPRKGAWKGKMLVYRGCQSESWFVGIVNDINCTNTDSLYTGERLIYGIYVPRRGQLLLYKVSPKNVSDPFVFRTICHEGSYDGGFSVINVAEKMSAIGTEDYGKDASDTDGESIMGPSKIFVTELGDCNTIVAGRNIAAEIDQVYLSIRAFKDGFPQLKEAVKEVCEDPYEHWSNWSKCGDNMEKSDETPVLSDNGKQKGKKRFSLN